MNQKLIITRGLSGSGKSTWSLQYIKAHPDFIRISRDDLRFMLVDGFMVDDDKATIRARNALIKVMLYQGYNLVLDETYLSPYRIKELNDVLKEITYDWAYKNFHIDIKIQDFIYTPLEQCLERNSSRGLNRLVPEAFIKNYYDTYVMPLLKDPGTLEWTI